MPDPRRTRNIRVLKTYLKILAALASISILWFGWKHFHKPRAQLISWETLTVSGNVEAQSFIELRDSLVQSTADRKTLVIQNSGGGDGFAALAIGILLRKHHWDVEIVDYCASACAIFIFPAGKTKYLHRHALLLFHGGPHQQNLQEMLEEFERRPKVEGAPEDAVILGKEEKEGSISIKPLSAADLEVRKFLSMPEVVTGVEALAHLRSVSDRFYQELGVNPLLPTHGQLGDYEAKYKSYEYDGFMYRLDSLRRLGVGNIELKDGEWQPEAHPDYRKVYEVTYP